MTGSLIDCREIHAAARLSYQGGGGSCMPYKGQLYQRDENGRSPVESLLIVILRSSDAVTGRSRTSVQ
jgi:hypothetical protein